MHSNAVVTDLQYPKSLGELCMEIAREKIIISEVHLTSDNCGIVVRQFFFPNVVQQIQALRQLMYHRPLC